MKTELKLGQIITEPQCKDAIHIAVSPMTSKETLYPGQHIGLKDGEAASGNGVQTIGIVDPFLKHPIFAGQQFWMMLYPQTITGLRHEWTHPDFPSSQVVSLPSNKSLVDKLESEKWLTEYVKKHCPYAERQSDYGYEEFLNYVRNERWIYYHGTDCHSLGDVDDADELFRHLSIVLDRHIDANYFKAFTCTC